MENHSLNYCATETQHLARLQIRVSAGTKQSIQNSKTIGHQELGWPGWERWANIPLGKILFILNHRTEPPGWVSDLSQEDGRSHAIQPLPHKSKTQREGRTLHLGRCSPVSPLNQSLTFGKVCHSLHLDFLICKMGKLLLICKGCCKNERRKFVSMCEALRTHDHLSLPPRDMSATHLTPPEPATTLGLIGSCSSSPYTLFHCLLDSPGLHRKMWTLKSN